MASQSAEQVSHAVLPWLRRAVLRWKFCKYHNARHLVCARPWYQTRGSEVGKRWHGRMDAWMHGWLAG